MDGVADPGEQLQPLPDPEPLIVGVAGQGPGVGDVLHGEERDRPRRAGVGACLVDLGDAGVGEPRQ